MDAECPRPRSEFPLSPFSLEPSIDGAVPKRQVGVKPRDSRGAALKVPERRAWSVCFGAGAALNEKYIAEIGLGYCVSSSPHYRASVASYPRPI